MFKPIPPFTPDLRNCEPVRNHLGEIVQFDGPVEKVLIRNGRLIARVGDTWHIIATLKASS